MNCLIFFMFFDRLYDINFFNIYEVGLLYWLFFVWFGVWVFFCIFVVVFFNVFYLFGCNRNLKGNIVVLYLRGFLVFNFV